MDNVKDYKYQLIFFGDDYELFDSIYKIVVKRLEELNFLMDAFIVYKNIEAHIYDNKQPVFIIYSSKNKKLDERLESLIRIHKMQGNPILPLYNNNFINEVCDELIEYNGEYKSNVDQIANIILEGFDLLRRRRRVFISYKRNESKNFALQLYNDLEARNYDVFLDTHSVGKAKLFQEDLWHEMSDSDVVVLLNTPGFLDSKWCKEELAKAESLRINVLRIDFSKSSLKNEDLGLTFFVNVGKVNKCKVVKKEVFNEIALSIERLRARSLASRHDTLVSELIHCGRDYGKVIVRTTYKTLQYIDPTGKTSLFVPAIGVPTSVDFHQAEKYAEYFKENNNDKLLLVYDSTCINKCWDEHLDWLTAQLKVKSLKKTSFTEWFSNN